MEKLRIWGEQIPGNSGEEKRSVMELSEKEPGKIRSMLGFFFGIRGQKYKDTKRRIDTFTWSSGIKSGAESKRFDDVPYLIPYIAPGSKTAVIVVPGRLRLQINGYGF